MSNPGQVNIGTCMILEQSRAIPDLQKLGFWQSRTYHEQSPTCKYWDMGDPGAIPRNPGPTKIGTLAIPELS